MICPFLESDCIQEECEMYNGLSNRCSISLLADIACSATIGYKHPSEEIEPIVVKVIKDGD